MGLARFFVTERYQKTTFFLIWLGLFVVLVVILVWLAVHAVRDVLRQETDETLVEFMRLRSNVISTYARMDEWLTAPPCSALYMEQLRRVAFLPDGINEFFHVSDGRIECSVNHGTLQTPHEIGLPDIDSDNPFGVSFWIDRDLGFLGMPGLMGTLAVRGNHGMIIPPQNPITIFPQWMSQEVVIHVPDGNWWYRSGEPGLFTAAIGGLGTGVFPHDGDYLHVKCDPAGIHCVTSRANVVDIARNSLSSLSVASVAAALLAALLTQFVYGQFRKYWDFEARFLRYLTEGVICTYQPIISTRTGAVVGCEVLARWRDLDGKIVFPDEFLPVVEKQNMSVQLTRAVIDVAMRELSDNVPQEPFQVNFNIFPRDFEVTKLEALLGATVLDHRRFQFVAEIVETEKVEAEIVQAAIDHLRRLGIRTYIDDFGVGYSNLQNLGMLQVDGVKIDRSFAMAPDHSVMARILDYAIEMAHASNRAIVIEGVETNERLATLRENALVDYAQGYFISRPLDIAGLVRFIANWKPEAVR